MTNIKNINIFLVVETFLAFHSYFLNKFTKHAKIQIDSLLQKGWTIKAMNQQNYTEIFH